MVQPDNEPELENGEIPKDSQQPAEAAPLPEILNWDACIETPPPRPSGTVKVRLHFRGRDKPIPMEEPQSDQGNDRGS